MQRKRYFLYILVVLLVLPSQSFSATGYDFGIIGAMGFETSLIESEMNLSAKREIGGRFFYEGTIEGHSVVVVTGGIGKVNAAMTTQILISTYDVKQVIMTGVAGGLGDEVRYGDLVIATDVVEHDYTRIYENNMEPGKIKIMRNGKRKHKKSFSCSSSLQSKLLKAAENSDFSGKTPLSGQAPQILKGRIASGDQFIGSSKMHEWLLHHYSPLAVDMETGAVGHVCETFKIPFAAIRGISDLSSSSSVVHYHINKGRAAVHAQQVVLNFFYDLNSVD